MLFNSLSYLLFLPLIALCYFAIPHRFRWGLLLAGSYFFYACWRVEYLALIIIATLVVYWAGLKMSALPDKAARRPYLIASLLTNTSILFFFKYFNFTSAQLTALLNLLGMQIEHHFVLNVLLPVGISYYTFQTMSYAVDVYRGASKPERHLGIFALYVVFFPQLLAGPIERSARLMPQLESRHDFDWELFKSGVLRILFGFFKKCVVADRLAIYVDQAYLSPEASGAQLTLASYFFLIQLYCDFSGYTDIAIGSARILGIRLSENFNRPFASRSIREYWQRWHITFTTWIRDYLFTPLLLKYKGRTKYYFINFFCFTLIGFWHGAEWTFIAFGAIHGAYLLCSDMTKKQRTNSTKALSESLSKTRLPLLASSSFQALFHKYFQIFVTFNLVTASVIFFRSDTLASALNVYERIFTNFWPQNATLLPDEFTTYQFTLCLLAIVALEGIQKITDNKNFCCKYTDASGTMGRWAVYYALILLTLVFGEFNAEPFIYFQF